jgi:hypothetical protein
MLPFSILISPSRTGGFVTQRQYVTRRQDVSFRRVLNLSDRPAGTYQPERAPLFAALEELPPELLNLRPEGGFGEVVDSAADDSVSGQPEQLARTATGVPNIAVIVRHEDGFSGWVYNRPEEEFQLFQTAVK